MIKSSLINNSNGKLSYDTTKYSSLDDLLTYGVGQFIENNPNISYNGVIGSDINISNLQITNGVYDEQSGLVFVVKYNNIQALSNISISNSTLMSINNTSSNIANVLTSYLSVSNNYQTFVNSLFANNILVLTNSNLTYNSKFSSFDAALTVGISTFITNNSYTYYDGILWSNINLKDIAITNAQYESKTGLTFTVTYNSIQASSNVSIANSFSTSSAQTNSEIVTDLTSYFTDSNNQTGLIDYLMTNGNITYENNTLTYSNSKYTSLDNALTRGLILFINNNYSISYGGILGWNINIGYLSISNASYSASTGLVFHIIYYNSSGNDIAFSNSIFSNSSKNNYLKIANYLTQIFSNQNNQISLIHFMLSNNYIYYLNDTFFINNVAYPNLYGWNAILSSAIISSLKVDGEVNGGYLEANYIGLNYSYLQNLGILASNVNTGLWLENVLISNAKYTSLDGFTFDIRFNNVSSSSNITISNTLILNNVVNIYMKYANFLTQYFNNFNNQIALLNYLSSNDNVNYNNDSSIPLINWTWNSNSYQLVINSKNLSYVQLYGGNFNFANPNSYYGGISGWYLDITNLMSLANFSYSQENGLQFAIMYNNISTGQYIKISSSSLYKIFSDINNSISISNLEISNALTNYLNNTNNQIYLINFLLGNNTSNGIYNGTFNSSNYITYSNNTWNYSNNYTSWDDALAAGICNFLPDGQNSGYNNNYSVISYDGILGSNVYLSDITITNASYNSSTGIKFTITYNNVNATSNVTISSSTLSNYIKNYNVSTALTNYFNDVTNQMSLINYLLKNNYIEYADNTLIQKGYPLTKYEGNYIYTPIVLSYGISCYISANPNISFDGILGSNINKNSISIINTVDPGSYFSFTIIYNSVIATSIVSISSSTFSKYLENNNISASSNNLTTYFNDVNNQLSLINYLLMNGYITYYNNQWGFNSSYTSLDNALNSGISSFISINSNISFGGTLGSNINVGESYNNWNGGLLSIANASLSDGLVFTIKYNSVSATSNVTISSSTLNNYLRTININLLNINNILTTYFSNTNNQIALISYLLNNDYITYSNGSWNYDSSNGYTSLANALTSGIIAFISANSNISFDGILGSNINTTNLSVSSANYDSKSGILTFNFLFNSIVSKDAISINSQTLNEGLKIFNNNSNDANTLMYTTINNYFNNINNQISLINYLIVNSYITYSNDTWNWNENWYNSLVNVNKYGNLYYFFEANYRDGGSQQETSNFLYGSLWFCLGLFNFISENILNIFTSNTYNLYSLQNYLNCNFSNINNSQYTFVLSNNTIFFTLNNFAINISSSTLNDVISLYSKPQESLTSYFSNQYNQEALNIYLIDNNYIKYENNTLDYNSSNGYTSLSNALTTGIINFIKQDKSIYYDGISFSDINTNYLSVINASYSSQDGLTFNFEYNNVEASNNIVTITNQSLNNVTNNVDSLISNNLSTYFNNSISQSNLVDYLFSNGYITYSNGSWNYNAISGISSWNDALTNGIKNFIKDNNKIIYNNISGTKINLNNLSIIDASYSFSTGLVFTIEYNNTQSSNEIVISTQVLNNIFNNN